MRPYSRQEMFTEDAISILESMEKSGVYSRFVTALNDRKNLKGTSKPKNVDKYIGYFLENAQGCTGLPEEFCKRCVERFGEGVKYFLLEDIVSVMSEDDVIKDFFYLGLVSGGDFLPKLPKNVDPSNILPKISFTKHALFRFRQRFGQYVLSGDVEGSARRLLCHAKEEGAISKIGRVKRIFNNKLESAEYRRIGNMRFVLKEKDDGEKEVLTVERSYGR